jgi:hypothetical protein
MVTVRSTTIPSVEISIAKPDEQKATQVNLFSPLTMVDAGGAGGNQAINVPRNGAVLDATKLLQTNCTLYQLIAEQIAPSIVCGT